MYYNKSVNKIKKRNGVLPMFQLTVEESISTLILLEDLIDNVEDQESVSALEYVHDEIDFQMLEAFGLGEKLEIEEEDFLMLKENLDVRVKYDVDDFVVEVLKAIFVPLLEQEDALTPQARVHAAKILFKIS